MLSLLRFNSLRYSALRYSALHCALLTALMLAGCSAGSVTQPVTPPVQPPPEEQNPAKATTALEQQAQAATAKASAKTIAEPSANSVQESTQKSAPVRKEASKPPAPRIIQQKASRPALRIAAIRPKPPAKPAAGRAKIQRHQPRRRYNSWAGIAVRRLPHADYLALLPHLKGMASWYGPPFHGKKTANGEVYNQFELTAAHLRLPMGTRIMVENQENRARVWVRINDRGPYKKNRILDLSRAAAARLGMIKKGTAPVRIAVVRWPDDMDPKQGLKAYGQFVVQVAAYPDALKAEGERRGLKSRFNKVPFRLDRTPKGLYSIWSGPYNDEPAAQQVAATLRKGGVFSLVRAYRK